MSLREGERRTSGQSRVVFVLRRRSFGHGRRGNAGYGQGADFWGGHDGGTAGHDESLRRPCFGMTGRRAEPGAGSGGALLGNRAAQAPGLSGMRMPRNFPLSSVCTACLFPIPSAGLHCSAAQGGAEVRADEKRFPGSMDSRKPDNATRRRALRQPAGLRSALLRRRFRRRPCRD